MGRYGGFVRLGVGASDAGTPLLGALNAVGKERKVVTLRSKANNLSHW